MVCASVHLYLALLSPFVHIAMRIGQRIKMIDALSLVRVFTFDLTSSPGALRNNNWLPALARKLSIPVYFVRERVVSKQLNVLHVPARDQLADSLTKPLSPSNYGDIRVKLKVFPCTDPP
jgi:hypothetical protein